MGGIPPIGANVIGTHFGIQLLVDLFKSRVAVTRRLAIHVHQEGGVNTGLISNDLGTPHHVLGSS